MGPFFFSTILVTLYFLFGWRCTVSDLLYCTQGPLYSDQSSWSTRLLVTAHGFPPHLYFGNLLACLSVQRLARNISVHPCTPSMRKIVLLDSVLLVRSFISFTTINTAKIPKQNIPINPTNTSYNRSKIHIT